MSIKVMTWVWEQGFDHPEQSIMLALADHANDQGKRIFPSVRHTAWKTGYSERQVQRIIAGLREQGILVVVANASWDRPTEYRIDFEKATPKAPWKSDETDGEERAVGGDKMSPGDVAVAQRGDNATAQRGDVVVAPESSRTVTEPSLHAARPAPKPPSGGGRKSSDVSTLVDEHLGKKKKRELTDEQEQTRNRMVHIYSDITGHSSAGVGFAARNKRWLEPMCQIAEKVGWDEDEAVGLVKETVETMIAERLRIKDPGSLVTVADNIVLHRKATPAKQPAATTAWKRMA